MNESFDVERNANHRVVRVVGDIDIVSVGAFRAALSIADDTHVPTFVDLSDCRYIDSTGISVLIIRRRTDASLSIIVPPDHKLQRIFAIAGLHMVLNVYPSWEAALAAVSGSDDRQDLTGT